MCGEVTMRITAHAATLLAAALTVYGVALAAAQMDKPAYKDPSRSPDERAADLLGRMTLDEKIGQMTQGDSITLRDPGEVAELLLWSVLSGGDSEPPDTSARGWTAMVAEYQKRALGTRLGIPIIYGIDAVHGHTNVRGAVAFPHNIGLGCTRNPKLVEEAARITADEILATGMHWDFAPCVAVPQDERWGRTYEGFGESPELATLLGPAAVRGLQGSSRPWRVLATAKHFVGDGGTTGGVDQGNTEGDEELLRRIHLPGYAAAIKAGAGSIMVSYNSWNGEKMHGHKRLLTDVLRGELGFDGLLVSDWNGIDQLPGDRDQDVEQAINAGIDMVMAPDSYREFIASLRTNVQSGAVPMTRVDEAVRRILVAKFRIGLFEKPFGEPSLLARVGSAAHRAVARQAVRESLVLLVNRNNALPIAAGAARIFVGGKAADDIGLQCGGWTISWQGSSGAVTDGTTVLQAIRKAAPKADVTFDKTGQPPAGAQVAVIVIGEQPYAEMKGDKADLALDPDDVQAVKAAKKAGIPVVVVLFSGRPLILEPILDDVDALVAAWLPGTEGDGIADVLFGKFNPTGRLSVTWPRSMSQVPINISPSGEKPKDALFDYGFGLSYRR
jgi:beta-glucosidase